MLTREFIKNLFEVFTLDPKTKMPNGKTAAFYMERAIYQALDDIEDVEKNQKSGFEPLSFPESRNHVDDLLDNR